MWLLDDTLPSRDGTWNPVQDFLRNEAGRRWFHETTGNLITVYLLDATIESRASAPEDGESPEVFIDVLSQKLPFSLANHRIAALLGLAPKELPALVGYLSLELDAYCSISLQEARSATDVKYLLSATIQEVKTAASEVLGAERTDALVQARPTTPVGRTEAEEIARLLRLRSGLETAGGGFWKWTHRGATMADILEKVADWL